MPKTTRPRKMPAPKETVQELKIDKQKVKYFLIGIGVLILINLLSSKKTYINENLEFVTCRGLKFGEMCLGSKEVKSQNIELENLIFDR